MRGGCHCGAIRFKVTARPYWIGACYCVDCQKISGATHLVFAGFKEGQIELIQGTPKEYFSSTKVTRSFCNTCSSPFIFAYKTNPADVFIPTGVFDDSDTLTPQEHIFASEKPSWVKIGDNYPQNK